METPGAAPLYQLNSAKGKVDCILTFGSSKSRVDLTERLAKKVQGPDTVDGVVLKNIYTGGVPGKHIVDVHTLIISIGLRT